MTQPTHAWIGLGANLAGTHGTPAGALRAAMDALAALPLSRLKAASRVYASDPVDATGPPYRNQVALIETRLAPEALLDELQAVEQRFGRERPARNAPRTLDLDILLMGDGAIDTPRLAVPHPRLHERLFVLMPMAELDPGLVVPGRGRVTDLRDAVHATRTQRCAPTD
jgi:2-amino-4-hydroxy-6-hydroxymethyldihydropteridine diphosphokinase